MKTGLFIIAHPNLNQSRANRAILEEVRKFSCLEIVDLYQEYPQFYISTKKEKERLLRHQCVILQHPFYWYNVPPLLKLWLDEVLEFGFAYGDGGTALQGKDLLVSITAGGSESAYQAGAANSFTIEHFLAPYIQTAKLCKMNWLPHLVLHEADTASPEKIIEHVARVKSRMKGLPLDWSADVRDLRTM